MKKILLCAVAVATTMSLTSCLSEEEVNLKKGDMGTITVNIEADNSLATRANVADVTSWYAWVKKGETDKYGTEATKTQIGTTLASTPMAFGDDYTVTVSNYANMTAALAENSGFGVPYYEGSETGVTVTAGSQATVNIDCGKAKNSKLVLDYSDFSGATLNEVVVTGSSSREVTFNSSTLSNAAYFVGGDVISYVVKYQIGDNEEQTYTSTDATKPTLAAGTLNKLLFKTNANGTISIGTITYDDKFGAGTSKVVTISAENGSVLTVEDGTVEAES